MGDRADAAGYVEAPPILLGRDREKVAAVKEARKRDLDLRERPIATVRGRKRPLAERLKQKSHWG